MYMYIICTSIGVGMNRTAKVAPPVANDHSICFGSPLLSQLETRCHVENDNFLVPGAMIQQAQNM